MNDDTDREDSSDAFFSSSRHHGALSSNLDPLVSFHPSQDVSDVD
jgi:hypothetical protein